VSEKGFSLSDQPFSVIEKGFSVSDQPFSITEKGFSLSDQPFSVVEKGFSLSEQGCSVTKKGCSMGLKRQKPSKMPVFLFHRRISRLQHDFSSINRGLVRAGLNPDQSRVPQGRNGRDSAAPRVTRQI
jgi:hypothetical protein